jgi:Putative binding domain, N-terminal/Viral BACON domain
LHRLIRFWFLASLVVGCASSALAQPVVDPRIAEFNPSPDHSEVVNGVAVVTRYDLEISVVGSSAAPVRVLSLGKPNPDTNGIVRVVIDTLLTPPLNVGVTYEARVAAVGPGGRGLSAPSNPFVFDAGTCGYDVTPTSRSVAAGGGNSTFSVATTAGCTWSAVSQTSWIAVTSGSSGSGNGTVGFSVAANTGPARSGTILIAGETVSVTQPSGTTCAYTITPTSRSIAVGGGSSTFSVATTSGCAWAALSEAGWITITSGSSWSGNGTVAFTAAANTGPSRTGTINIAGQDVSVTQASGVTCTYNVSPLNPTVAAGGGAVTITVTGQSGCAWTAAESPTVSWVSITSGASGSGNGIVSLSVTANSQGSARTMSLIIAGRTVTLTQSGTAPTLTAPKKLRVIGCSSSRNVKCG